MSDFPKYRTREVAGRTLWWEDLFAGLGHYHLRLYYPDHTGNLRLVFINDDAGKIRCTLVEQTLKQEFGITYKDLGVSEPDTQLREYERLKSLDHLCTWPQKLYPEDPQHMAAMAGLNRKLSPDIHAQIASGRADAWI